MNSRVVISLSQDPSLLTSAKTLFPNQVPLEASRDLNMMSSEAIVAADSATLRTCLGSKLQEQDLKSLPVVFVV